MTNITQTSIHQSSLNCINTSLTHSTSQQPIEQWSLSAARDYMSLNKVTSHLLKIINYHLYPQAVFIFQSTVRRKSTTLQTSPVRDGSITLVAENILALATDKHLKIEELNSRKVTSFHLGTIKPVEDKELLSSTIAPLISKLSTMPAFCSRFLSVLSISLVKKLSKI